MFGLCDLKETGYYQGPNRRTALRKASRSLPIRYDGAWIWLQLLKTQAYLWNSFSSSSTE